MDAALRMEGLPSLILWETILRTFPFKKKPTQSKKIPHPRTANADCTDYMGGLFANIDYVPCTLPLSEGIGRLVIFEVNDAVIKMCIKGRSPAMRHVARTHRIDLDWLWERMRTDPGVFIKYVGTKKQIADMFTKGAFTTETWRRLCRLAQIGDVETFNAQTRIK